MAEPEAPLLSLAPKQKASIGASRVRDLWSRGTKATRMEAQRFWVNSAYVQGEQWIYVNNVRNQIVQMNATPRRVRATIPRLRPELRRIVAKLLRRKLVFEVAPSAADDASMLGARIAEAVLEGTCRTQDWEQIREDHLWATLIGGTGILALDWDPSAGESLGTDPFTGKGYGTGEVSVSALSVTEVATEPGTTDLERARWWIKGQALPAAEVQVQYGLKKRPKADATAGLSPYQQRIFQLSKGTPAHDLTLVLTYYERPTKQNPDGLVALVVGEEVVEQGKWPFPFTDRLNVAVTREIRVLKRWTGDTVVSDAVPVQTALNAAWSSILEHQKHAANARLMVPDYSMDLMNNLTDQPGEIIPYNPSVGEAKWLSPPQMPEWWLMQPEKLAMQMDDILGVHDISRGEAPRNIESGSGLAILAEQDETPTGGLAARTTEAWARIATMILQTYEKKVGESRTAMVRHPGAASEQVRWTGRDLAGQTTAIVPYDAVAPVSDAARKAQGFAMWDRGLFGDDPKKLDLFIGGPGDSFIEAADPDVARARRENHELAMDKPCLPETWDSHTVHIAEHNRFRKSARYQSLSGEIKQMIQDHIQGHENLAAEEMAKQVNRADLHPALGAAATAEEPPTPAEIAQIAGAGGAPSPASPAPVGPPEASGPPPADGLDQLLGQVQGLQDQASALAP